ncbi:hypothetical protein BCT71_10185 [Vibrio sp. 10N.261.51.A7]|nr:hypothetical protein BCT71_10185 [Vibrio sp. 10N.261.51.A7]
MNRNEPPHIAARVINFRKFTAYISECVKHRLLIKAIYYTSLDINTVQLIVVILITKRLAK